MTHIDRIIHKIIKDMMQHFILMQFARETREMTRKKEKYLVIAPVSDYV